MSTKLTQKEFIKIMAQDNDLTIASTEAFMKAFLSTLRDCVMRYDSVPLHQIGTFELKHVKERSGVSKLQGDNKVWVKPAHKTLKFKVSKCLLNEIFEQTEEKVD